MFRTFTQELGLLASCCSEYVIIYTTWSYVGGTGLYHQCSFLSNSCLRTYPLVPHSQVFRVQLVKQEMYVHSHTGRTKNKTQVFPSMNKCSNHWATQKRRALLPALLCLQQLCDLCSSLFFYVRLNGMFCVENKTSQNHLIPPIKSSRKCWRIYFRNNMWRDFFPNINSIIPFHLSWPTGKGYICNIDIALEIRGINYFVLL